MFTRNNTRKSIDRRSNTAVRKSKLSRSPNKTGPDTSLEVASNVLEAMDTPLSLSVFLQIKYGEFSDIVERGIDPLDYLDPSRFADDYLSVNLLRKASHLKVKHDPEKAALANFSEVEQHVETVNRELVKLRWYPNSGLEKTNLLLRAASICHRVLQSSPQLGRLPELMGFGGGSSSSCSRARGSAYFKSAARLDLTPQLLPHGHLIVNALHPWAGAALDADGPCSVLPFRREHTVRGARLELVPKDAKTHRVIAVEPHVNMVLQRGINTLMERRLKRWGIDITDQRHNQRLAEDGYDRGYSTIDLSNASDCVSVELVRWLLPEHWFSLLDTARSHYVQVEGVWRRLEKFSTAGCGFTFPLETLVFYAISYAATGRPPLAVYGDDIIVHDSDYDLVVAALASVGFSVNNRKSFSGAHPFRESCGEDFFLGYGVRPFFIRGPIRTLSQRISLHNQMMRYTLRRTSWSENPFKKLYSALKGLRKGSKLLVPYDIGDAGFAACISDALREDRQVTPFKGDNPAFPNEQAEGYMIRCLLQRPYRWEMRQYYASLYHSFTIVSGRHPFFEERDLFSEGYVLNGTKVRWAVAPIPVREWSATDTFPIGELPALG